MALDAAGDLLGTVFSVDDFAVHATYTAPAGTATACHVLLDPKVFVQSGDAMALVAQTEVSLLVSEVGNPVRDATITIAGVVYLVDDELDNDGQIVKVKVTKQP